MSKMEKKRPNKRKSLADLNAKPKKIQRTSNTPVSQKINFRSLKPTNVKNGKHVNGNISSDNSTQFTQVNKRNGKQNTAILQNKFKLNKYRKNNRQFIDESDEEAESEEKDNSDAEINNEDVEIDEEADSAEESQNDDNADSDDEDVELEERSDEEADINDEANSDEESDNAEANSDDESVTDEADSAEESQNGSNADSDDGDLELEESSDEQADINNEANSDEEADNSEVNSDDEIEIDKADSAGESQNDDNADSDDENVELEENSDEDADIDDNNSDNETDNDEEVEIDQEADSEDNDDEDDANEVENHVQKPIEAEHSVLVEGVSPNIHIQNIFKDCKINTFKIIVNQTKKFTGNLTAVVNFDDKKSVEKALAKQGKIYNQHTITVKKLTEEPYTPGFTPFFIHGFSRLFVTVKGLDPKIRVDKFFWDCKIKSYDRFGDGKSNSLNNVVCVYFEDEESVEKALKRNKTLSTEKTILVKKGEQDKFKIHISGLTPESRIWHIFRDCHIRLIQTKTTDEKEFTEHAFVYFIDKESMKKALTKNGTEHNGSVLTIESNTEYLKRMQKIETEANKNKINPKINKNGEKIPQFGIFVNGLSAKARIDHIFKGCEIESVKLFTNPKTNHLNGRGLVNFKDDKSFQRALRKNGTMYQGSLITVEERKPLAQNLEIMKKKMLLNEMISQVRKLEQEICKTTKPSQFNRRK